MTPPGHSAAMIAVADTRAPGWRLICERHAGSGPRGSHQLGKTPIRPLPTAFCRIPVSVPARASAALPRVARVNPTLIIVTGT